MVYRVFVEKKPPFAAEARAMAEELRTLYGVSGIERVRIINRYDAEDIRPELFEAAKRGVFAEPQLDDVSGAIDTSGAALVFAVEYLPGQFDQRADSAAQCIQILSAGERPIVATARVYAVYGRLSEADAAQIKKYVINPVESREASMALPETLKAAYAVPTAVDTLTGFTSLPDEALSRLVQRYGLAMDGDDLACCRAYFQQEGRDPTITELRVLDTYWSDHCRHTTFLTEIDGVSFEDDFIRQTYEDYLSARASLGRTKPVSLMDLGTIAAKYLKAQGKLDKLDESEEINACTVRMTVTVDGEPQDWLLLFKNETHNHPTEIEPFGGAATCIGGAIRDPLSGRAYVYAAMRVTGAADPTVPVRDTLPGKLPQRKLVTTAAAGYASYGNQIGLATGQVDEIYHPGYAAKRMEIGAVIGAAPAANVRRERPAPGDVVLLLGGRTGRDGCGGATGSSKSHTAESLATCGAEVQKGNAPEERKLQRLFRNPAAARMIKRCNDFGAGGVSVAVGELADGLEIDLNAVPKKYEGLDGTELAISESQERMAVVVAPEDAARFTALADAENLECTPIAVVTAEKRLTMKWNGATIVDLSRAFLDSNGAAKHATAEVVRSERYARPVPADFAGGLLDLAADLNVCSKRGLSERFDATIGAGTVLMPFGGKYQRTPVQAMVHKISLERGDTDDCSFMAWGYNPYVAEKSPYIGAYLAVVESVSKLIAAGADRTEVYLTFQEYFEKLAHDPKRWGKPLAALLGAFKAQTGLGMAAIGGKDSMSGSFESLHVPPTLVSFAVTHGKCSEVVSGEFKAAGHPVVLLLPEEDENGLPETQSLLGLFDTVTALARNGSAQAIYTPGCGGVAEAVLKMALGNEIGFRFDPSVSMEEMFALRYGAFVIELDGACGALLSDPRVRLLGRTTDEKAIAAAGGSVPLERLLSAYEGRLESVYPCNIRHAPQRIPDLAHPAGPRPAPAVRSAKPRVLIPVFPGTNCEYDTAKAAAAAGAEPEIFVVLNRSAEAVARSVEAFAERLSGAQMLFIPGGFSGGDEPDGSGKFIAAFFRNAAVREQVELLLERRKGLICGVCNGFQALIKLGLVPFGRILDMDASYPTLTYNTIARHQSRIVRTRIVSNRSPWLAETQPGEIYHVPVSHGEGRFLADERTLESLIAGGQIATQYADFGGHASFDVQDNPNDSVYAIEGITSPDGLVLGKMGHSERIGSGLYRNVPGTYDMGLFRSAVRYFR